MNPISFLVLFALFFLSINTSAQLKIVRGCGFDGPPPANKLYIVTKASEKLIANVDKILLANGMKKTNIVVYESTEVQYALAGRDDTGRPCILINSNDVGDKVDWLINSIIAHELGHIYLSHIYTENPVTIETELEADYFSGFTLKKLGCPSLEIAKSPYKLVTEDDVHPAPILRENKVDEGWKDASIQYKIPVENLAETYDRKADIFFTVTKLSNGEPGNTGYLTHKVDMSISLKDHRYGLDEFMDNVEMVIYELHETFDRKRTKKTKENLKKVYNDRKNNFGLSIRVWGYFPVAAHIYFKDGGLIIVRKQFTF